MAPSLSLRLHPEPLSIARLDAADPAPVWVFGGPGVAAVVRGDDELGVVCATSRVPAGVLQEEGWVALEIEGPLDFALTGILLAVAEPLAAAGVSIFALSTFDTDLILVRSDAVATATEALARAGHTVSRVS